MWNRVQWSPDGPKPTLGWQAPLLPAHHRCLQWTVNWGETFTLAPTTPGCGVVLATFAAPVWYVQELRGRSRTPGARSLLCKVSIYCADCCRRYLSTDSQLPDAMPPRSGSLKSIAINEVAPWPQSRSLPAQMDVT